ncbi:hypothetical protein [Shinella sp. BYT-45]|uniref:hypothetical protein n=1 Tax=Shinella sp. BYT-45 TaxID=3377377 RepID=UPI003980D0B9
MSRPASPIRLGQRRTRPMPSEAFVYHALADGRPIEDICTDVGMSRNNLLQFISARREAWEARPPKRLVEDERRIVVMRESFIGHAYRQVSVSLPRISMHVAARTEGERHG